MAKHRRLRNRIPTDEEVTNAFQGLGQDAKDWLENILTSLSPGLDPNVMLYHEGRRDLAAEILGYTRPAVETTIIKNVEDFDAATGRNH